MSNKYTNLSKNTLLFTINSFGTKIISFLLVPLYTYVLSSEDYGTVDLVTSAVSLLVPILTVNIQDAVLRFSLDKNEDKKEIISVGIKQNIYGGIILAVILILLSKLDILKLEDKYLAFLFGYYLFTGLYNSISMYLKAKDKIGVLVISGLANTLIACMLNIVLLLFVKMGIDGYMIANIAGIIVAVAIMFFAGEVFRDISLKTQKKVARQMILYCLPLVFNSVAWWINNASDKYVLTIFCGVAVNGIFAVAYKMPTILSTIQNVFYSAWSISAITEFDKNDSDGFLGNMYTLYSCVSIIGCSVIILLNIPLARILYAKEFFSAWEFVPFLMLGAVFNGLALFEGCLFTAVKKTKEVSYTTLVGAGVNFCVNIVLIKTIGPIGVSIATMMGYFTTWVIRTWRVQEIVKLKVNWKREIIALLFLTIQTILSLKRGLEWVQLFFVITLIGIYFRYVINIVGNVMKLMISKIHRK